MRKPIDENINAGHAMILYGERYSFSMGIHFVKLTFGISRSEQGKQVVSLTAM